MGRRKKAAELIDIGSVESKKIKLKFKNKTSS